MVTGFLSATLIVRQYLEPASLKPIRIIIPKNYYRVLNERIVCAGLVRQQILPYVTAFSFVLDDFIKSTTIITFSFLLLFSFSIHIVNVENVT